MGKDIAQEFPEAKRIFEEVDDTLQQNLSTLIFEGPIETLTLTENAQPALMTVSMAILAVLKERLGVTPKTHASFVAGHSLGEYTALCASESLTLRDTALLLKKRGRAMQEAVHPGEGAMAAIIGVGVQTAEDIVREVEEETWGGRGDVGEDVSAEQKIPSCQVANDNSPVQVVISGTHKAIELAEKIAKKHGAKRFVILNVSAPFHSSLMHPARKIMSKALASIKLSPPSIPLIANITARPEIDPTRIRALLIEQITGRVRWRESVEYMVFGDSGVLQDGMLSERRNIEGEGSDNKGDTGSTAEIPHETVEKIVEIGAGKVLAGLVRKIAPGVNVRSIGTLESIRDCEENGFMM